MNTELLLPAGKPESLKAAVANGADAVYLAGSHYGARAGAGNFDESEMRAAVKLGAKYGCRLYVTMNTLVADEELSDALDYAKFLYDLGVDGVIVQDIGFAAAIKELLPALPLHGSTQMTIHDVAGARWAYDFGFQRVILSREMTLKEIAAVRDAVPDLELEVFCHGALCICYSGRCLMSSLIGGRSGNRGRCAQPCRLPYRFADPWGNELTSKPAHLLSPKDLNTLEALQDLTELGIAAIKVEGRMRRPEYVATVGRVYRRALDNVAAGRPVVSKDDAAVVEQVFNRDFTIGYLKGNPGKELMSYEKPNNRGVFLGRVAKVHGKIVTIALDRDLTVGDGIEIWVKVGGRLGVTVSDLKVAGRKRSAAMKGEHCEIFLPGKVKVGDRVFKTYDAAVMATAMNSYDPIDGDVSVDFNVTAKVGENLEVTAVDRLGHSATVLSPYRVEAAKNQPTDVEQVKKQLSRLGGSGYRLGELTLKIDGNVMIPASVLNQCRRDVVSRFDDMIFARYPALKNYRFQERKKAYLPLSDARRKNNRPALSVKVADSPHLIAALDGGAERILFAPHLGLAFPDEGEWAALKEFLADHGDKLVYALPAITREEQKDSLYKQVEGALKAGFRHFSVGHVAGISLKEKYREIASLAVDHTVNAFNRHTAKTLFDCGFDTVAASLELDKTALSRFAKGEGKREVVVHGALPMMVSRHCPIGALAGKDPASVPCGLNCRGCRYQLIDRMGMVFPVVGDLYHSAHIYNCRDLCLLDELDHLKGFSYWRIEGMFYDIGSLKEIIALYRTGREQVLADTAYQKELLMEELAKYPLPGYTKGHFYRGVTE